MRRNLLHHPFEHGMIDPFAAMALGERDDADRQRLPAPDALGKASSRLTRPVLEVEPDQFARPAADIEKHCARRRRVDERSAAGDRETRLGLARDDLKAEAGLVPDAIDECQAVLGETACLGRDQP